MDPVRLLVVALCAAVSVSVALIGGFLVWIDGASPAGAGTFAGTLALALAVVGALSR